MINNGNGTLVLHFLGVPGQQYSVQATASLSPANWQVLAGSTATAAADGAWTYTPATSSQQQFFRSVALTP